MLAIKSKRAMLSRLKPVKKPKTYGILGINNIEDESYRQFQMMFKANEEEQ